MKHLENPIKIIGIELRTTNDNGQSFHDIPPFWDRFIKENCVEKIPSKRDQNIYAVYTHFENAGKNNFGMYSLIIGCEVTDNAIIPDGFVSATIPAGNYRHFSVENGSPDKVGETWQKIWNIPANEKKSWRFQCEYECYRSSGEIDIFIGVNN